MASAYPQQRIGRQVRRADGTLMEEVITTTMVGNKLSESSAYRPVGGGGGVPPPASNRELKALLGEEESDDSEEGEKKKLAPVSRTVPQQQRSGDNPTMDKLTILKKCLDENILTRAEFDALRKEVLDAMMASGGTGRSNPTRVEGRQPREAPSPESVRRQADEDSRRYIQRHHRDAYKNGKEGEAGPRDAGLGSLQPTGIDGLYYTGRDAKVVDVLEEELPERRFGSEHKPRIMQTTIRKELLDSGVVRVVRTDKIYDGYSRAYLTMHKAEKMKPKLFFSSTAEYDWDEDFKMELGTTRVEEDKVEHYKADAKEDEEYERVMKGALGGREYTTRNVNNAAGKGDLGWNGEHMYPGGKPEQAEKEKRNIFGKKKPVKKDPNDKWSGFDDAWEDTPEEQAARERGGRSKPGYKKGERRGIFNTKKAEPKPQAKDKMMGENPADYKMHDPTKFTGGSGEHLRDDGSGAGGFQSGEQWGSTAKQHTGKHAAGGSHFMHQDMWK